MSKYAYPYGKKINQEEVIKMIEIRHCKECNKEVKAIKNVNKLTDYGFTITLLCPDCSNIIKDEPKFKFQREER